MPSNFDLHTFTRNAKASGSKLLAIYLTCGFPQHAWTTELACAAFASGADLLELGMPFSDPLADGPTIQAASQQALNNGITAQDYFEIAAQISPLGPTLFMGYLNSITTIPNFRERAGNAGLCGLILPEWPVSSSIYHEFEQQAKQMNLPRIPFVAPTTSIDRIALLDKLNAPFIYAVSITGVTGARSGFDDSVLAYLAGLQSKLSTPFLAGFGVSTPEAAQKISAVSDGVIVGSALLNGVRNASTLSSACQFVIEFVGSLRTALDCHA